MKLKDKLIALKNSLVKEEQEKEVEPNDLLAFIGEFPSPESSQNQKYSLYRSLENGASVVSELYNVAKDNTVENLFPHILYPREDRVMTLCEFENLREHYESLKQQFPEMTQSQLFLEMKKYQGIKKPQQKLR